MIHYNLLYYLSNSVSNRVANKLYYGTIVLIMRKKNNTVKRGTW